eukprot:SAG11_NODE_6953_length_1220_cov_1.139161_1_plen_298_part_01
MSGSNFIVAWSMQLHYGQGGGSTMRSKAQLKVLRLQTSLGHLPMPHSTLFTQDCKQLYTCEHWDNSVKIFDTATGELIQSMVYHRDLVCCLALSEHEEYLALGSRDSNLSLWPLAAWRGATSGRPEQLPLHGPGHTFFEHTSAVTCVALSVEYDMVVSGSDDGTIVIHTMRSGEYLRTIDFAANLHDSVRLRVCSVVWFAIDAQAVVLPQHAVVSCSDVLITARNGAIICAAADAQPCTIAAFSLNGRLLSRVDTAAPLLFAGPGRSVAWATDRHTELLLTVEGADVVFRDLYDLTSI